MGIDEYDANAPWARVRLSGDAALRRPGASARDKAAALRPRGFAGWLARRRGLGDHARWAKGAEGEVAVGRALDGLPDPWQVVHDVPLDGTEFNVDHVVVGPPGVFSLNTKNLSGKVWVASNVFMVNGCRKDYLRKSRAEACDVAVALRRAVGRRPYVRAVIVVLAPKLTIKEPPRDVTVVSAAGLVPWLTSLPPGARSGAARPRPPGDSPRVDVEPAHPRAQRREPRAGAPPDRAPGRRKASSETPGLELGHRGRTRIGGTADHVVKPGGTRLEPFTMYSANT
ncbi:MAG TPA: nuclease-related domain-containing protein [Actinomycetota bacterium]|nr:nuclease-related domain-containing protein [Actinomycetota bacterium]